MATCTALQVLQRGDAKEAESFQKERFRSTKSSSPACLCARKRLCRHSVWEECEVRAGGAG
eukprot:10664252-Lingulodinium_polyedra.AAC.1